MAHRRLTEGCIYAMRAAAASPAIFNRTVADNLRVVAKVFPRFVTITTNARRANGPHGDAAPILRAHITPLGLAYLTPRKALRRGARQ